MLILTTEAFPGRMHPALAKPQTGCGSNRLYAGFSALALVTEFSGRVHPAPRHWRKHIQATGVIVSALTLGDFRSNAANPTHQHRKLKVGTDFTLCKKKDRSRSVGHAIIQSTKKLDHWDLRINFGELWEMLKFLRSSFCMCLHKTTHAHVV